MEIPKIRGHYFHVHAVRFEVYSTVTEKLIVCEDV
jgi:hypothetical protein